LLQCCNVRRKFPYVGCILPSGLFPCSWLSHAQSSMPDTTPPRLAASFPFHSNPPPARSESSSVRLDSRIVPSPGFAFCASISISMSDVHLSSRREPQGLPLQLTGFSVYSACLVLGFRPLRHRLMSRYGWVANPYPTGTFTPQKHRALLGAITLRITGRSQARCERSHSCERSVKILLETLNLKPVGHCLRPRRHRSPHDRSP
jgi:hypothetical protein